MWGATLGNCHSNFRGYGARNSQLNYPSVPSIPLHEIKPGREEVRQGRTRNVSVDTAVNISGQHTTIFLSASGYPLNKWDSRQSFVKVSMTMFMVLYLFVCGRSSRSTLILTKDNKLLISVGTKSLTEKKKEKTSFQRIKMKRLSLKIVVLSCCSI